MNSSKNARDYRINWTDEMVANFKRMWHEKKSIDVITETLGISKSAAYDKRLELGLPKRHGSAVSSKSTQLEKRGHLLDRRRNVTLPMVPSLENDDKYLEV